MNETYKDFIREDGYVDATRLSVKSGKRLAKWRKSIKTKEYIKLLCENLELEENKLIEIKKGGNHKVQGTWIHPLLATNLGAWISIEFSFKISTWIEEWKKFNDDNKNRYDKELNEIKADENLQPEFIIKERLYSELGGIKEYETKFGYIDLLTDTEIIEIKVGYNWKHGVGQLLAYGEFFPKHIKRLHLFDILNNEDVNLFCRKYDIRVSYE
jgi:hypothetical protein